MSAPVSSLSLSSCLNSTVMALSQSRPASSTSVVLLMKKEPKKSVARIPEGRGGWRYRQKRRDHQFSCHISLHLDCFFFGCFQVGKPHLCWFAPSWRHQSLLISERLVWGRSGIAPCLTEPGMKKRQQVGISTKLHQSKKEKRQHYWGYSTS